MWRLFSRSRTNSYKQFLIKTLSGSFNVRNPQLKKASGRERNGHRRSLWSSITVKNGSVQHLEFLSEIEKAVYKTAFEIDQRYLVELAGDRTKYVCQAQSLNIFLKPDVHKRFTQYSLLSMEKGIKKSILFKINVSTKSRSCNPRKY